MPRPQYCIPPPGMIFESLPCDTSRLRERRLIQNGIYNNWACDIEIAALKVHFDVATRVLVRVIQCESNLKKHSRLRWNCYHEVTHGQPSRNRIPFGIRASQKRGHRPNVGEIKSNAGGGRRAVRKPNPYVELGGCVHIAFIDPEPPRGVGLYPTSRRK